MIKRRVGIFGGTFNPPHNGHITSAEAFLVQMELDELFIIPAFIPPHKEYRSDVTCEERLEMCRLAFSAIDSVSVSDLEIRRGGKSYTYLTLEALYSDDAELFFLCGTDMILSMDTWKYPERIFKMATVCYARRENDCENDKRLSDKCKEYEANFGARICEIKSEVIDISSSEIRASEDVSSLEIPVAVAEYILKKGLYK